VKLNLILAKNAQEKYKKNNFKRQREFVRR